MIKTQDISEEAARIEAVHQYAVLDTAPDPVLDDLTAFAAEICGTPIALISIVDTDRQWFKSRVGLEVAETAREISFCTHVILQRDLFIVPDATQDERFSESPLVTGEHQFRFYAGAPLVSPENAALGTLCVIDHVPRRLTGEQQQALRVLARHVMAHLELRRQARNLAESERRLTLLASIVEYSDDAIIGKDLNGIVTSWNQGAKRIFGYSSEEMVGCPITKLIPTDRLDEETNILRKIKVGESVEHFETMRQTKGGGLISVSVTASPIKDSSGKVVGVSKVARDISDRKNAEEARRAIEERYRTLFDYAPDGIVIADLESKYLDANPSICKMLGYSREEFVGLYASDVVVQKEIPQIGKALDEIKAKSDYHREWEFRRKDGSVFHADVIATQMPDGNILGMIRDITGQKLAQERMSEQAALLEKARDAILVRDLEGKILFWNHGAERIYGWKREEVIGHSVTEFLYSNPQIFADVNRILMEQGEWRGELHHITRSKREITVEGRWTLIRDDEGRPKSVLAINTDVTERKKIEAQFIRAQRMESIGTLAGGVAHDLNNILTPIMMSVDVLKELSDNPQARRVLETIEVSAKRGSDIVRQVLSFARGMEGDRIEIQPRHIMKDLESIISNTLPKDIRLHFSTTPEAFTILGDPTQIHQILLNLCVNARDAMPHGGTLTVSVENCVLDDQYSAMNISSKPGRYVIISVADSGTGIPSELLDKIFEPFFTTKPISKGTGLGLSTVVAIVKSHGGFVNVYSEPGNGTTFKVYLPAMETSPAAGVAPPRKASLPRGNGETVLIVDDESAILEVTGQTLEAFGYRVLAATDGADAVAVYVQHRAEIAVVITDMMMPVMDGGATIQALLRINPAVKIVAASGLIANGGAAKTYGAEVKHFLTKPYTAETLLNVLRSILGEK